MRFLFTERAAPFLEVGFDDIRIEHTGAKWDIGRWDDDVSRWTGIEPTWRDVSCEIWEASCEYGRAALTDRFVPGQANVIARNLDGWGDPKQSGMRPGRPIRFGVDHAEFGRIIIFRGFIDAVVPVYDPTTMPTVELQCIDALAEVNRAALVPFPEVPEGTPLPNHGETANLRINRILDRSAWPSLKRDIDPTSWRLIGDYQGGQVADLLGKAADSVGGAVWGDRNGDIGFRGRDWQMFDPAIPVDGHIGNLPSTDPNQVCPGRWERPMDRASFSTRVIMGRNPETAIQRDDIPGQVLYGIESFERVDLLTFDDLDLADLADRTLVSRSHKTAPRVRTVTFDGRAGDAQVDLMTTVDVFKPSHYQCSLIETDGRLVFNDRYMATAVAHQITAANWSLEMNLDLAFPYEAPGGKWDEARWDQARWVPPVLLSEVSALRAELERTTA